MSHFFWPHGLIAHHYSPKFLVWNFPDKNTAVGCHVLLQGIFLTQGSDPGLLSCNQILHGLSHQLVTNWNSEVPQSTPTHVVVSSPLPVQLHPPLPLQPYSPQSLVSDVCFQCLTGRLKTIYFPSCLLDHQKQILTLRHSGKTGTSPFPLLYSLIPFPFAQIAIWQVPSIVAVLVLFKILFTCLGVS